MVFSILISIVLSLFIVTPTSVKAFYDPLSVPNNKFGIHVAELSDMDDAATLVNSTNGDWGYVTVVIQDGDRNQDKWQEIFNTLRRKHLIPIVRLATHPEGDSWKIPGKEDADRWANFLNSLLWPVENRYVILFNEPNHSKEWENSIDPEGYADIALTYAKKLKEVSPDFFLLPAGLDMAASTDREALEGSQYLRRMYTAKPELFQSIDGWTSHSYPNPGFSASPFGTGKGSIASFLWELQFLQSLGVTKKLPVFITETGWTHNQGKSNRGVLSPERIGDYLTQASDNVWNDPSIVAITPFLLNYQGAPFDHFSWKKLGSSEFYPQYDVYKNIPKIKGAPNQKEAVIPEGPLFPNKLVSNSIYTFTSKITNNGQSVIDPLNGYTIKADIEPDGFTLAQDSLPILEPNESGTLTIHVKTPQKEGEREVFVYIQHNAKKIPIEKKKITIVPPPSITVSTTIGWKTNSNAKYVTVLLYDTNEILLHKFSNLEVKNGRVTVSNLYNMVPGKKYRLVLLLPYYLPRQTIITLEASNTTATVKRIYPFDFNGDGALGPQDIGALLFSKPNDVFSRFF